jgi:hypothetical protein
MAFDKLRFVSTADLFLHAYEADFFDGLFKNENRKLTQTFNSSFRFILKSTPGKGGEIKNKTLHFSNGQLPLHQSQYSSITSELSLHFPTHTLFKSLCTVQYNAVIF